MTTQQPPRTRGRTIRRIAVLGAALFTAWHLFASFLWIAPYSDLRDVVPDDALSEYMLPMFGQSWSVFAPEPINGDYYFDVRAVIEDNGEEEVTEWVRASDVEQSLATYRLFPPRAAKLAAAQSSGFRGEWQTLNDDHRAVLELNYYQGDDWQERLESTLLDYTDDEEDIDAYLREERRSTAYATQVAQAIWGEDVVRVQYQVARQNVIPWAERNNPAAEQPDIQPVPIGWRGLIEEEHQSQEEFADYFCSAPEEVCLTDED